jgi:hypothetical protein
MAVAVALSEDATLVEFMRLHELDFTQCQDEEKLFSNKAIYIALVLRKNDSNHVELINLREAEGIDSLAASFLRAMNDKGGEERSAVSSQGRKDKDWRADASKLWNRVIAPISKALIGTRHVLLVPDAELWTGAFEAMMDGSGKLLVDAFAEVSYLVSGREADEAPPESESRIEQVPAAKFAAVGEKSLICADGKARSF